MMTAFSLTALSTLPVFALKEDQDAYFATVAEAEEQAKALGFAFKRSGLSALATLTEANPKIKPAELLNALQDEVEKGAFPKQTVVIVDRLFDLSQADFLYLVGAASQLIHAGVCLVFDGQLCKRPMDVARAVSEMLARRGSKTGA